MGGCGGTAAIAIVIAVNVGAIVQAIRDAHLR